MSHARWIEIEADLESATGHFSKAVQLYERGGFDSAGLDGYAATMAFLHSMQSGHTSLESGLKRILKILGEELPIGDRWHEDLINRVAREIGGERPAILDAETAQHAHETRRFRNLASHGYEVFRAHEAQKSVAAARALADRMLPARPSGRCGLCQRRGGSVIVDELFTQNCSVLS